MEPDDFMKRGFLQPMAAKYSSSPDNEVIVREQTMVWDLAKMLGQTKFTIIADLMQLGVFVTVWDTLDFETVFKVVRKHGFMAKRD